MTVTVTEACTLPDGRKVKRGAALFDTDAQIALGHPLLRRRVVAVGKPEAFAHLRPQPPAAATPPVDKTASAQITSSADKTSP